MTIVVSFDGLNLDSQDYAAKLKYSHEIAAATPQVVERTNADAYVGGIRRAAHQLAVLEIAIEGTDLTTLRNALFLAFNPRRAAARALIIRDDDGGNQRYVMAQPQALNQVPRWGGRRFAATLVVHGDVSWRATAADTQQWAVTATGQTTNVTNGGDLEAHPKITITPTSSKSAGSGNPYRRFIGIHWTQSESVRNYPFDIADNSLDTQIATTNFASATGDDIRVLVDGDLVDYWIQDPDTSTTQLWVNLDFDGMQSVTLATAIAASGGIATIDAADTIDGFPASGILRIDDELFTYTGRNLALKQFTGVTRAAKGSSMAAHDTTDTIKWIQHEIWITYGDSTLSAYSADDRYKPAFRLDSTNSAWDFDDFGDDARLRSGSWKPSVGVGANAELVSYAYSRDHSSATPETVTPWQVIGLAQQDVGLSRWTFFSPLGISAANFTNGKKWTELAASSASFAQIQSASDGQNWASEYEIPATTAADTWDAWSQNVTSLYVADQKETKYIALKIEEETASDERYKVQAADVQITFQNNVDRIDVGEISSSYPAAFTITNVTTGDAISIEVPVDLNGSIEIDSDARTVKNTDDNSNLLSALTLVGGARSDWLPLATGTNVLQYDESGAAGVTIDLEWIERFYD